MMDYDNISSQIATNGYALLNGVISKQTCDDFVVCLEEIYANEHLRYANNENKSALANKSLEKVVYNLHNKTGNWMDLLDHEIVHKIIGPLLQKGSYKDSEPFYLYNSSARNPLKGNPGQQIHVDSNLPGINYSMMINALWYLEDSTPENGGTVVIPNTVKTMQFAEDGRTDYPDKMVIEAKAGDVLIFDANLWHGGGPNISGLSRWAAVLGYARWFIKPSFDTIRNTSIETYNRLTERQKRLLGFDLNPPRDEYDRITRRAPRPEEPR